MTDRRYGLILTGAIAASMVIPLIATVTHSQTADLPGQARDKWPAKFRSGTFAQKFEKAWEDRFGLRRPLVRIHSRLSLLLRSSPTSTVLMGRDRWLYLNHPGTLEAFAADRPFTSPILDRWIEAFRNTERCVGYWGGRFVVLIAPNKATIHPEHLPWGSPRTSARPTRLDQFIARAAEAGLTVVDVRSALEQAARSEAVYGRYDSHWTARGTAVVADETAKVIGRLLGLPVPGWTDRLTFDSETRSGDLAMMMLLEDTLEEVVPVARLRYQQAVQVGTESGPERNWQSEYPAVRFRHQNRALPSAVVIHDSFGPSLMPFLAELFSDSLWLRIRNLSTAIIPNARPTVLLFEMAERFLHEPPPAACRP